MVKLRIEGGSDGAVQVIRDLNRALFETEKQLEKNTQSAHRLEQAKQRMLRSVEGPQDKYNRLLREAGELFARGKITQDQLTDAATKYRVELDRTSPSLQAAAREAQRLAEQGRRITEQNLTPQERYNRSLMEVGRLYRAGTLSQEAFVREARRLKAELQDQNGTTARLAQEQQRLNELRSRANAIVQQGLSPLERYKQQVREVIQLHRADALSLDQRRAAIDRLKMGLQESGRYGQSAFGSAATSQLASYVTGLVSLGSAASVVANMFQAVDQRAKEAAASISESLDAMGVIQQLDNAPEVQRRAFELRYTAGFKSPTSAAKAAMELDASGLSSSDQDFLVDMARRKVISPDDVGQTAQAIGTLQRNFMTNDPQTVKETMDKLLVIAKPTKGTAINTANAMSLFATTAAELKYTMEESGAAFNAAEQKTKNAEMASEWIASLMNQIMKNKLSRGTLAETLDYIERRKAGGETEFDILKESNAVKGYLAIQQNRKFYEQMLTAANNAQGQSDVDMMSTHPLLGPAVAAERAEGRLARVQDTSGRSALENLMKAALLDVEAKRPHDVQWRLMGWWRDTIGDERTFIDRNIEDLSPETQEAYRRYAEQFPGDSRQQNADRMAFKRMEAASERTAAATERMSRQQGRGQRPQTTRQE